MSGTGVWVQGRPEEAVRCRASQREVPPLSGRTPIDTRFPRCRSEFVMAGQKRDEADGGFVEQVTRTSTFERGHEQGTTNDILEATSERTATMRLRLDDDDSFHARFLQGRAVSGALRAASATHHPSGVHGKTVAEKKEENVVSGRKDVFDLEQYFKNRAPSIGVDVDDDELPGSGKLHDPLDGFDDEFEGFS